MYLTRFQARSSVSTKTMFGRAAGAARVVRAFAPTATSAIAIAVVASVFTVVSSRPPPPLSEATRPLAVEQRSRALTCLSAVLARRRRATAGARTHVEG